jgi:hypothetical protein
MVFLSKRQLVDRDTKNRRTTIAGKPYGSSAIQANEAGHFLPLLSKPAAQFITPQSWAHGVQTAESTNPDFQTLRHGIEHVDSINASLKHRQASSLTVTTSLIFTKNTL